MSKLKGKGAVPGTDQVSPRGASVGTRAKRGASSVSNAPRKAVSRGAQAAAPNSLLASYLGSHKRAAAESLRQQLSRPFASLLTWAVIGVALALPLALFVVLSNLQGLAGKWQGSPQITLYLIPGIPELDGGRLAQEIAGRGSVEAVEFISSEQALGEFVAATGLGEAMDYLGENPLPHVIVVKPVRQLRALEQLETLAESFSGIAEVESVQLDVLWVQRLFAMTRLLELAVWILGITLSGVVLLVLGNTIRLAVENRRDEIVLVKLVGGTDGFVRRPFLYSGLYFGLFGGVVAVLLVQVGLLLLAGPIADISVSYQSDFSIGLLGLGAMLGVLMIGMVLGWIGAFISVNRHIVDIEPR